MVEERIEKAANDLANSRHAVALTGAGISTESGIPDFRGPNGIWTKYPEMERKAYQIYGIFLNDPVAYWKDRLENPFLHKFFTVEPNPGHQALAELEEAGIIQAVLTQNIDNLHQRAGSRNVMEYHGNINKLRCISCSSRCNRDDYDLEKMKEENTLPPLCPGCGHPLKTDVVYFQEPIPQDVAYQSYLEAQKCDVMLICGTSANVYPFASLPTTARSRPGVTIIEINAEPTPLTTNNISDYIIQGYTGEILPRLSEKVMKKLSAKE